jgi:hypothetical protein
MATLNCDSNKICGWITAISQLTVAACVLYVGYLANEHMKDMADSWGRTADAIERMEADVRSMDKRMWEMNNKLGNMRSRMSPWGMMMP